MTIGNRDDSAEHRIEADSDAETAAEVKEKSIESLKWTYLTRLLPAVVSPVTLIVLASLLVPSDFALVAIAATVLSLLNSFQDVGLSKAIIQSNQNHPELLNLVFWANLAISLFLYLALLWAAPLLGTFFKTPESVDVIRILGCKLILSALGMVQRNIMIKRIQFRGIFYVSVIPATLPLIVTIPLAYFDCGVWALVIGDLLSVVISTLLLWIFIPWRPDYPTRIRIDPRPLFFGFWITLEALVGWFYIQGDNAIVGRYFTTREFGIYVVSYNAVVAVIGTILTPVSEMAYPVFCRLQQDRALLSATLLDLMRLCALVSLPVGAGICLVSGTAVPIIFGDQWRGMERVMAVLALTQGLAWVVAANPDVYKAIGRPDTVTKFQLAKLLYTLPAYLGAAQFTLMTFVYAKLAVVLVGISLWAYLTVRTLPIAPRDLLAALKTPFYATSVMILAVLAASIAMDQFWFYNGLLRLIVTILTGMAVYVGAMYVLDKPLFIRAFRISFLSMGLVKNEPVKRG
jgi:O-antigen/teichoic acid export membrane protein